MKNRSSLIPLVATALTLSFLFTACEEEEKPEWVESVFLEEPAPPKLSTFAPSEPEVQWGADTATLAGRIESYGDVDGFVSVGICLDEQPGPTLDDLARSSAAFDPGDGLQSFQAIFYDLIPATTYYYRSFGEYQGGETVYGQEYSFTTDTVAEDVRVISLSGDMDFGEVFVGEFLQRTLTLSNQGSESLTVTGIETPAAFDAQWSGTIPAGEQKQVVVSFFPIEAQTYDGTLTVNSNATSGVNSVAISGSGSETPERVISLSGDLDFGEVLLGSSAELELLISCSGNQPLFVPGITLPEGFAGEWSGTIPAGASQPVGVTFTPTEAVRYEGALSVASDATEGESEVDVAGEGTLPTEPVVTDGLLAYYTFDDGTANNQASDSYDGIVNGVSFDSDIPNASGFSAAFFRNGSGGDYINLPQCPASATDEELSITFWMKTSAGGAIYNSDNSTINCSGGYHFGLTEDNFRCALYGGIFEEGISVMRNGEWHHIAITMVSYDFRLYIDGTLYDLYDGSCLLNSRTNHSASIGEDRNDYGLSFEPFEGKIDNFRVYERVVSPEEVGLIYASGQ